MKKIIVFNWKMNPKTGQEAVELFSAVKENAKFARDLEIAVCPPFLWLRDLAKQAGSIKIGGQNCHWETNGAFTGEISAPMLAESGAKFVIIGHSERRHFLGETDDIVNSKIRSALKTKLHPILCVGEKEGEEMYIVLENQLVRALEGLKINQMKEIIIAYEPVWAVFTDAACLPDAALSANLFIKKILTKLYSRFLAEQVPVIYGGSVNSKNAAGYFSISQMQGLLVGGASLEKEEIAGIISNTLRL